MLQEVRAAGLSKDSLSELFNLFEITVELKVKDIIIYVYKLDDSALTVFQDKLGKVIMENCNIVCLVNLKLEESNHYSNSNCLLCQRCWLLCAPYGV